MNETDDDDYNDADTICFFLLVLLFLAVAISCDSCRFCILIQCQRIGDVCSKRRDLWKEQEEGVARPFGFGITNDILDRRKPFPIGVPFKS